MNKGDMMFENNNYTVTISEDMKGYAITNKQTGVLEGTEEVLPNAIFLAESYTRGLEELEKEHEVVVVHNGEAIEDNIVTLTPKEDVKH